MPLNTLFQSEIAQLLSQIYQPEPPGLVEKIEKLIKQYSFSNGQSRQKKRALYSHKDVFLITYGDSIRNETDPPLSVLERFMDDYLQDMINSLHILPFFPYSSDDGFSVIDYKVVHEKLGDWHHIESLASKYKLMGDLVINHISSQSEWFSDFMNNRLPGMNYFHSMNPDSNLRNVTRPRSSPLLTPVLTKSGVQHVWTTFSPDQVDVNFSNPSVLLEYIDILLFYLSKGIKVIRLDAVAYLWKKQGTTCIHLNETHLVVKLLRLISEYVEPESILITETNVPHKENISYFGDGDEAHMVYNFSLPPLLLHAILTGNASYLSKWSKSLTPPPPGCTYFNFTATHDGIGVRPLEGLVPKNQFDLVVKSVTDRGGMVSYKRNSDGTESPYELNIAYFDAFAEPIGNTRDEQIKRFMCSQALMLSFRGVPAIYIHSLTGTFNYHKGVRDTGMKRTINRMKWDENYLKSLLDDPHSVSAKVLNIWRKLLSVRRAEPAFDPQGGKKVLTSPPELFAMWRSSSDEMHQIIIVGNVSRRSVSWQIPIHWKRAKDLISGQEIDNNEQITLDPWQVMWLKYEKI